MSDVQRKAIPWKRRAIEWFLILLLVTFGAAVLSPLCARARDGSFRLYDYGNVRQQALALIMYREDHDRVLPLCESWMDALQPYIKGDKILRDPALKSQKVDEFGYAYFSPISGSKVDDLRNPHLIPMTFQSRNLRWNANGCLDLLPFRSEKRRGNYVSFVDGHAKYMGDGWRLETIVIKLPE